MLYVSTLFATVSAIALLLGINAMGQEKITVGPNVQVSAKNSARAHFEAHVAADPANSQRLLACTKIHSSKDDSIHSIAYATSDGGKSWTPTIETDWTNFVVDPDCTFGLDGAAYFGAMALQHRNAILQLSEARGEVLIYRSPHAGGNWEKPVVVHPLIDREYLTVDQFSEKYRGRVYLEGNAYPTVDGKTKMTFTLLRSGDRGATFQLPVNFITDTVSSSNGQVLSDGTYVFVFRNLTDSKNEAKPLGLIGVMRSENGGDSFEPPNEIDSWYPCTGAMVEGLPMISVDHTDGPFKDRLDVVWSDMRSGHCDVRFSYSADKGRTWSRAKTINDEPDRNSPDRIADHHMPVVAVNNQGVVGISWYDRREHPDDIGWWTRFTASLDGGETFLPSIKVSEAPHEHRDGERLPIFVRSFGEAGRFPSTTITTSIELDEGEARGGDTAGMAADANGRFHAVWVDNRTGILQLWTATVSVTGSGIQNGSGELAALTDVTPRVMLDYADTSYDPETGTVSFDATLTNTSMTPISVPIKLRVVGLEAGSGTVQVVNADNRQSGTGAVWDFSGAVEGGLLNPGEKTRVKRFQFHLVGIHPFRRGTNGYIPTDLIRLESKVLAKESQKINQ